MKVLLINQFEKIPGEDFRDQRYTYLYNKLKMKADVKWISSDFHHWSHQKRNKLNIPEEDKENIILLKTIPYDKNVSLKRFLSHSLFSLKVFIYLLRSKQKYDVMLIIAPVENLFLSTIYAKYTKTRVIIDIIDIWPDLFEHAFPKRLKFIAKILLFPFHLMANYSYKKASHITSVSKTYTNIAMERGKREDKENSSYFYLGAAQQFYSYNMNKDTNTLKCLFAGQFEHSYDIELILEVAKKFSIKHINVEFYLAGSGKKIQYAEDFIKNNKLSNVKLLGWLSSKELLDTAKDCHIGLNSYKKVATQSIPTKIFDYMGLGLVIVNSLDGEVQEMINADKSGQSYFSEDIESLYNVLDNMRKDIKYLITIGNKNKNIFDKKYCFDAIYDEMVNLIMKESKHA